MNRREQAVKRDLENQGYETIHAGIQDFVAVKDKCPHCEVCPYIKFVEAKSEIDKLSLRQRRARAILQKHGFNVTVERRTESGEKHHTSQPTPLPNESPQTTPPDQNTTFQFRSDQTITHQAKTARINPSQTLPNHASPHQLITRYNNPIQNGSDHTMLHQPRSRQLTLNHSTPTHITPIQPTSLWRR